MAKSVIKNIYGITPRTVKGKEMFSFNIMLEDGAKWNTSLQATKESLKVWQEIEYTISDDEYKNIVIKQEKKARGWSPEKDYSKEKIISSMECAVNLVKHRWTKTTDEEILPIADKILARYTKQWL